MKLLTRLTCLLLPVALLAGCATAFSHVASGEVTIKDRLSVIADRPWNQFERGTEGNIPTWTQDGVTVDALRFYVGIKDGQLLMPNTGQKADQPLLFKASMQPQDIASLFGAYYSRGGSTFQLEKIEPADFAGAPGVRFEFSGIRKVDEVRLRGVVWASVRNGELFAISYTAPRLAFYPRHLGAAQALAASARVVK